MSLRAFRLVKARHSAHAFDGEGARRFGGRWNHPGTRLVYASGSISLAALELLVHLESVEILAAYDLHELVFDEAWMVALDPAALPARWREDPAPPAVRALGDAWVASGESAVLRVPSVLVPEEWNVLLNPDHPDFARIERLAPRPFRFDRRLGARGSPRAGRRRAGRTGP